jgi:hypothetical protein
MSHRMNAALGVSGLAMLVTGMTLSTPRHVNAQLPTTIPVVPVKVTNTPLPVAPQGVTTVSGTVGISSLPPVQAQQAGPWTMALSHGTVVGLADGSMVNVGNSADNPVLVRDVDRAAGQSDNRAAELFQSEAEMFFINGFADQSLITVPAGKRLVVDHESVWIGLPFGEKLFNVEFSVSSSSHGHRDFLAPQEISTDFGPVYLANHQTQFYANAGDSVGCGARKSTTTPNGELFCTISGHFVTMP